MNRFASIAMLMLVPACADVPSRTEIPVRFAGTPFESTDEIALTEARVTITSVELLPCDSVAARLSRWVIPAAHAHVDATPTRLGAPVVLDALDDETFRMGTFTPSGGQFCGLYVLVTPADDDALLVDDRTLGNTLTLRGSRRSEPVDQTTALSYDRTFPLDPPLDGGVPVALQGTFDPNVWMRNADELPWDDEFLLSQSVLVRALDGLVFERVEELTTP